MNAIDKRPISRGIFYKYFYFRRSIDVGIVTAGAREEAVDATVSIVDHGVDIVMLFAPGIVLLLCLGIYLGGNGG